MKLENGVSCCKHLTCIADVIMVIADLYELVNEDSVNYNLLNSKLDNRLQGMLPNGMLCASILWRPVRPMFRVNPTGAQIRSSISSTMSLLNAGHTVLESMCVDVTWWELVHNTRHKATFTKLHC